MSRSANTPQKQAADQPLSEGGMFLLERLFPFPAMLLEPLGNVSALSTDVIVAFDTNALLLPYGIGGEDLKAISTVLGKLSQEDRVVVPARVIREFAKLRERKLADMVQRLNEIKSKLQIPVTGGKLSPLLDGLSAYNEAMASLRCLDKAMKNFQKSLNPLIDQIKGWRGDDPVSKIYRTVFTPERILEPGRESTDLIREWNCRREAQIPPGYKDAAKDDGGVGDFIIWMTLLRVGKERKKDLIFVTGEEKADWFVRSGGKPLYPRPELVDEYKRMSSGRTLRLCSLPELLQEMEVPHEVVADVKKAEAEANVSLQPATVSASAVTHGPSSSHSLNQNVVTFDYSTHNGRLNIFGAEGASFAIRFSKASNTSIHFYKIGAHHSRVARLKHVQMGDVVDLNGLDTTSDVYTIQIEEGFLAESLQGEILVGRVLGIKDDTRGDDRDEVVFRYSVYRPGEPIRSP